MAILSKFAGGAGELAFAFLAFIVVLTVVVFIHELAHFAVARWCGVKVTAFSICFGREIWGFTDRHGTRWRIGWIPLGGYVKWVDDENAASAGAGKDTSKLSAEDRAGAFNLKPLWQKSAIVAAGPISNFILAIVIFAGMAMWFGVATLQPRVAEITKDSAAERAGMKPGDLIRRLDGETIGSFDDVRRIVALSPSRPMKMQVDRAGQSVLLTITPDAKEEPDTFGGTLRRGLIGVKPVLAAEAFSHRKVGLIDGLGVGVKQTTTIVTSTVGYIRDVFAGRQRADQIGGAIQIAQVSSREARKGFENLLALIGALSASIGFINLLPIPVLDGGHLLFYSIEAIIRRPLSDQFKEVGFKFGLATLLTLMLFTTVMDVTKLSRLVAAYFGS
jgi:regulator of sigma E protease